MKTSGHIYLLREREFIKSDEDIYKIGKTTQSLRRFKGYPHDSHVLLMVETSCLTATETRLIRLFKDVFIHKHKIGNEYFEGDPSEMKRLILTECCTDIDFVIMRAEPKKIPVSAGFLKTMFQALGIFGKDEPGDEIVSSLHESESCEPLGYFGEEIPATLNDAMDMFIRYIKDVQPIWYVGGVYITSDKILEEFIYITGFIVTISALSKKMKDVIYDDKKRKKIDGMSKTVYKLIDIKKLK